jgi:hypothetical protein
MKFSLPSRVLPSRTDLVTSASAFSSWLFAGAIFLLFAPRAFALAQVAPGADPSTGILGVIAQWPEWQQALVGLLVSIVPVCTALGHILAISKSPRVQKVAGIILVFGIDVQKLIAILSPSSTSAEKSKMQYQRGFSTVRAMAYAGLAGLAFVLGCSFLQSHPAVAPDAQKTEQCVAAELLKDTAAGDTPITIGIDLGVQCGADAVAVFEAALAQDAPVASATSRAHVLLASRH